MGDRAVELDGQPGGVGGAGQAVAAPAQEHDLAGVERAADRSGAGTPPESRGVDDPARLAHDDLGCFHRQIVAQQAVCAPGSSTGGHEPSTVRPDGDGSRPIRRERWMVRDATRSERPERLRQRRDLVERRVVAGK